jgi:hypothetical protein
MTLDDIEGIEIKYTSDDWIAVDDLNFGIPRSKLGFSLRMKIAKDVSLLPDQTFDMNLHIAQRSEQDVELGDFGPFEVIVTRSVYGSELEIVSQGKIFYEGSPNIVFYSLNQPVVEDTLLELTFTLDSLQQKPLTDFYYRTAIGDPKIGFTLDVDNKAVIPMVKGVESLIIEVGVSYDIGVPYPKGVTIDTKEIWSTQPSFVDDGVTSNHFTIKTPSQ